MPSPLTTSYILLLATLAPLALCQQRPITINGNWSPWSTLSTPCTRTDGSGNAILVTCGGGLQTKVRSCTNPRPQGLRPTDCMGDNTTTVSCNTNPCDMQWSPWSNCSATCSRGSRQRHTLCAQVLGGNLTDCKNLGLTNQSFSQLDACNTWDKTTCPNPCDGYNCMEYASCLDLSSATDPAVLCVCQLGRIMNAAGTACVVPPPTTSTARPIPTLAPAVKTATTAITKTASTILIVFVSITLFLFASLGIYDDDRVIQMNMEIALICAHFALLVPSLYKYQTICKVISILIHFFFTATFMFMFLESLHTYSLVAFVVKRNGLFTKWQNVAVGWGIPLGVVLLGIAFRLDDYGGAYHCWLRMDTPLLMAQFIPLVILVILTFTLIEAAGAAEYRRLPGMDYGQLLSAKIMQRTNLIIMPLTFASFITGSLSEYEQNVALYSIFTILNGVLGACVFFFHSTGNEKVRAKLTRGYNLIFKKD